MRGKGWILDVYVDGACAVLWVKLDNDKAIRLTDGYRPDFYVEVEDGVGPEGVAQTISLHPLVVEAKVEEKYVSILDRKKSRVIHVSTCDTQSFRTLKDDVEKLHTVKSWFNIDLYHFQRYLFSKTFAPTDKVEVEWDEQGKILNMLVVNDLDEVSPPPFTSLLFEVNAKSDRLTPSVERDPIEKVTIQSGRGEAETLDGAEEDILAGFACRVRELDPDFLVANNCEEALRYVLARARMLGIRLQLGREPARNYASKNICYAIRGRAIVNAYDFLEFGVAGICELSRFTLASPTHSSKWPAGKTIDARQSYEALRKNILIPKRRGFPKFAMTAKEIHEKDKGGLLFSPVVGLHENVGELDFESTFPNIIIRHNISYETVTPTYVDKTRRGFLGEVVALVLGRRLHFKHLRKRFPTDSEEYRWCNQRQKALKTVLVCIYGFSGCFANRFNNVAAYNEINAVSRRMMVKAVNTCLAEGFEILYGNVDSIFVKRRGATREDYEALAATIQRETSLPISLDNHYRFIVFMRQETHPDTEAMNHFFGKLADGGFNCRGIELRRRDCPAFLKEFQRGLIEILFDANNHQEVVERQIDKAKAFVHGVYHQIMCGDVDFETLAVSKRVHREVGKYKSMFPHVIAAKHLAQRGKRLEKYASVDFVFLNAGHRNPLRRVLPVNIMGDGSDYYDREKYGKLLLDTADTILKTLRTHDFPHSTLDAYLTSNGLMSRP